jgi:hypothetical protein
MPQTHPKIVLNFPKFPPLYCTLMIIHYMIIMRCLYQTHWLLRGWSHWPVQTPSISISGSNSVKSGRSTFIFEHNPHRFHGWNWTESLVWSRHEVKSLIQYLIHESQHLPLGIMPKATSIKKKCTIKKIVRYTCLSWSLFLYLSDMKQGL